MDYLYSAIYTISHKYNYGIYTIPSSEVLKAYMKTRSLLDLKGELMKVIVGDDIRQPTRDELTKYTLVLRELNVMFLSNPDEMKNVFDICLEMTKIREENKRITDVMDHLVRKSVG